MMGGMPSSRRSLRVLHTADIHLDSDSVAEARDRSRRVLQRIVDRALADAVDLVVIAGDLFDHNRVPDESVGFVRGELDRLRQPVVILPGNHDALYPNAIYDRHDFTSASGHVRVIRRLDGETLEFPELDLVVWGRAMREHEPAFSPLANLPVRDERRWSLATGHGFFYEERQRPERSSPIFAEEIRDSGWDYVALGHHHLQADVSQGDVAAWYAGSPGTVLMVHLTPDGIRVEPRSLDGIESPY